MALECPTCRGMITAGVECKTCGGKGFLADYQTGVDMANDDLVDDYEAKEFSRPAELKGLITGPGVYVRFDRSKAIIAKVDGNQNYAFDHMGERYDKVSGKHSPAFARESDSRLNLVAKAPGEPWEEVAELVAYLEESIRTMTLQCRMLGGHLSQMMRAAAAAQELEKTLDRIDRERG